MIPDSADDNIPTLTDVIVSGDESMKNHFDGHSLDEETETEATELEAVMAEPVIDEPAIEDEFKIEAEIDTDDIVEPVLDEPVIIEPAEVPPALNMEELHATIESIIDEVLQESMPVIEKNLKAQLSESIYEKLSEELKN